MDKSYLLSVTSYQVILDCPASRGSSNGSDNSRLVPEIKLRNMRDVDGPTERFAPKFASVASKELGLSRVMSY